MIEYLVILAMGLTAFYAWPAARTFAEKVWTITFALFLAPFSWPWLIARGHRARKAATLAAARQAQAEAEQARRDSEAWWKNEFVTAELAGDNERAQLARDVLASMGFAVWGRAGNRGFTGTS